jgi:cell division protease FtsH
LTQQLPAEDRYSMSREGVLSDIAILMGGRAAEEVMFGTFSTGAGNDIERATELARKMICEWGMSERMGPVSFGKKEDQIFLGREMASSVDYSEQTAIEIDSEIRRMVQGQYQLCKDLLTKERAALERISEALLQYEVLDGAEIDQLIRGEAIKRAKPESRHLATPDEMKARREKEKGDKAEKDRGRKGLLEPFPKPEPGEA